MTQKERRLFLIRSLLEEQPQYRKLEIPGDEEEQKRLLRSLMNLRRPSPAQPEFLDVQDAYLKEETLRRGIVDCRNLAPAGAEGVKRRLFLWQGDITRLKADAIVNAANEALLGCFIPCHSCIDNIIHTCAGVQLRLACDRLMREQGRPESTGRAKITPAFNLPSRYVLHTVGPVISGPLREQDCRLLAGCYSSCLELAAKNGLRSVAFCCISTGVFRFPQEKAAEIAVETVKRFLEQDDTVGQVIFNVFTDRDLELYRRQLEK
ncbi:protein-ADP-ribose hydrolase [Enterocloster lavalensis]|uniref:protein-ADP-ribose hydrolase n=1 Tax=Enterocloster lavalensis TaxID=460384 RepID=UPI002A7F1407|nr:protein-ADP-ribose hydrolase [Enterocloster lavalensis]